MEILSIDDSETLGERNADDKNDYTAPFYEAEAFDSIWEALRWRHVRARVPFCLKKTLRSRYMLANLIYLGYAIGILIVDFNSTVNGSSNDNTTASCNSTAYSGLDQPICNSSLVTRLYIGTSMRKTLLKCRYFLVFAVLHIVSAFFYWWAWHDRSWRDTILIPEYMNYLEAGLYLWSALWYRYEDTIGGYYTLAVHRIEMTAASVELIASFGWSV